MDLVEANNQSVEAMSLLWDQLGNTRRMVQNDPTNQSLRRHLLYDFCIYNEVSLTSMKQFIRSLDAILRKACIFSSDTRFIEELHNLYDFSVESDIMTLLSERTPDSDDTGKLRYRQRFLPKLTDVRLTYRTYSRVLRISKGVNFNSGGWCAFRKVIDKRNNVTHASSVKDLLITDDDLNDLVKAHEWVQSDVLVVQKEGNKKLEVIAEICNNFSK